jgi:outer membrane protein TolC
MSDSQRAQICWARQLLIPIIVLVLLGGCSREYYRHEADRDAYQLIAEKQQSDWGVENVVIDVAPESRMYDPNSIDAPPMPPDDPDSHRLMHCVDCKAGYACWHQNGDTDSVENPYWQSYVPLDEDGVLELSSNDAYRLALIHSRQYQGELEDLYLSALDVSFERFRFDTQFFAAYNTDYAADGRARGGATSSTSTFGVDTGSRGIRMETLYPTGAELVVGLANSLVWQFSGSDSHGATTLLDFALVQPLLRQGGRDRVMERLTIAERSLLGNVRQMERFRRGFYLEVTTGREAGEGPSRRGGFFGGAGLDGFTGVGGGGFGRVGGGGGGFTGGAGAGQAGGYLGLLQEQQTISNQEANIAALRSSLAQLEAFFLAGRIDYYQVELARQALYNAQSRLLNDKTQYEGSLDGYKLRVGLPPQIEVRIKDDILNQFNLIDPEIVPVQDGLAALQENLGERIVAVIPLDVDQEIVWNDEFVTHLQAIRQDLAKLSSMYDELRETNVQRAVDDINILRSRLPQRMADLDLLAKRIAESGDRHPVDSRIVDSSRLEKLPLQLNASLAELKQRLDMMPARIKVIDDDLAKLVTDGPGLNGDELATRIANDVLAIPGILSEVSAQVLELALIQVRARTESVELNSVDMDPTVAIKLARDNRRDWKNARANLVDAWRLVQFNADDLESNLDIVFSGDISNTGDNPLRLRDTTGRLQVGLQFDAPISRLGERNTYRQALIEYQQARRNFYAFEDQVANGLRSTLRTIELHKVNFELRRAAVHVAVAQVELARLRLQEPPKPNEDQTFGATTARDLVSALADLLNVQNDFLSVWVNFEVQRRSLDFDLGTMQVDPEGIWLDPGEITNEHGTWQEVPLEIEDGDNSLPQLPADKQPEPQLPAAQLPPLELQEAKLPEAQLPEPRRLNR